MLPMQACSVDSSEMPMAERISHQQRTIIELQTEITRLTYEVLPPPLT